MKKKMSRKSIKQMVDVIENNLEQHLHRVHELRADIMSGQLGVDVEKCAAQIKTESMGIIESFLWLQRYHASKYTSLNYTSKNGLDTAELCTINACNQIETEMDSDKPKEESFPLTKKNAICVGFRLHMKLTMSESTTCELDFKLARKTVDDILREKIEKYKWVPAIAGFSNKR